MLLKLLEQDRRQEVRPQSHAASDGTALVLRDRLAGPAGEFSRTVWITFHWRGTSSSVSVTSSPSFASLAEPQHGQEVGAGRSTTRSRGR